MCTRTRSVGLKVRGMSPRMAYGVSTLTAPTRNGRTLYKKLQPDGSFYKPGRVEEGAACLGWTDSNGWMFHSLPGGAVSNDWPYKAVVDTPRPPCEGWVTKESCGREPMPRVVWLRDA